MGAEVGVSDGKGVGLRLGSSNGCSVLGKDAGVSEGWVVDRNGDGAPGGGVDGATDGNGVGPTGGGGRWVV